MRIVVTGGAGYIGSVTAAQLVATGHDVTVVDDLSTGHRDAVPCGARFAEASVAELADVFAEYGTEAVVHCAAKSLVGESMTDPAAYWHGNVVASLLMLDAMREHGVGRIVFSSSAAVYGSTDEQPILETAPTQPTSTYGATKLAVDLALTDYARQYGFAAVSLRYFNVAGALITGDARYGERHAHETHLVPNALRAATRLGPELSVFGTDYPTADGTCVRDYIHVVDLGLAHQLALTVGGPGEHHIVNLGSGTGSSVREVLATVAAVTGYEVPVVEAPRRAGDPPVLIASNAKAAQFLGWRPTRSLAAMVDDAWRCVPATTA
jgi:UDP-glucose 4-epimerase